jgi:hypothetical protein
VPIRTFVPMAPLEVSLVSTGLPAAALSGFGRPSNTTVTGVPFELCQESSARTSRLMAPCRSRHHPSGRAPMTFMPSISHRTLSTPMHDNGGLV